MKNSIKYIGLYIFTFIIAPRILNAFIPSTNPILYNIIAYTILGISAFVLFKKELSNDFQELRIHPWKVIGKSILTFCLIIICSILLILIIQTGKITQNQSLINNFLSKSTVSILIVVILGPFVEEIVFRHILIGKFTDKVPLWLLCILSIITFSMIHVHAFTLAGILEAKQYIIIGTALTIVYVKNKNNLVYPLTTHIINNLIVTILSLAA